MIKKLVTLWFCISEEIKRRNLFLTLSCEAFVCTAKKNREFTNGELTQKKAEGKCDNNFVKKNFPPNFTFF